MVILAIDTSTSRTDVALVDGDRTLAHLHAEGAMAHGEVLGSLVQQALSTAFIQASAVSAVAVGTGPGPFTGLRVGLVFARTFAFSRSIPVLGIGSLEVLSATAGIEGEHLVVTDARRKEIYWAHFRGDQLNEGPCVDKPHVIAERFRHLPVVGEGARHYGDLFPQHSEPYFPSAVVLARLARAGHQSGRVMPVDAQYLRQPDVTV